MTVLTDEKCAKDAPRCAPAELTTLMAALPNWFVHDCSQDANPPPVLKVSHELRREFRFKNYYHVMSFVNALAWVANKEGHHPDLEVSYGRVLVRFSTHDVGGLSRNDFVCAAKTDALLDVGDVGPVLA